MTAPPRAVPGATSARVRLVGKPGCHLCDAARATIATVCADAGVAWEEVSILDDPALADQFWEQIPVTIVDGTVIGVWQVDPGILRAALRTVA